MTKDKLMFEMDSIFKHALHIASQKNADYSSDADALENFRDFGWKGIIVRIGDKWKRLRNFFRKETYIVTTESFEDTLLDTINYCALCLVMYREEVSHVGTNKAKE